MMWILIMSLNGSWASHTDFSALATQEFGSKASCEQALAAYKKEFNTGKNYDAKAICVSKE